MVMGVYGLFVHVTLITRVAVSANGQKRRLTPEDAESSSPDATHGNI
jgi:hypothetical protein